jgi:hypothetical protein
MRFKEAALTGAESPVWVKLRRTQCEKMSSELPAESGHRSIRSACLKGANSDHSATAQMSAALTGKRGGASDGAGTNATSHLKRLAFTFSVHRLDLDARASQVLGAARGSRPQQAGSIFHGIRAVHATGRSAHRHQYG